MKFSEKWLRSFVDPACTNQELAQLLTMAGLEVEAIEPAAATFDNVVVAQVISVEKHPDADRLHVCKVDVGQCAKEPLQIVCGAPNVYSGIKVPCALVNAKLPGFTIKKAKLRGVESSGMLCSSSELGMGDVAEGLLILPDSAPIGEDFRSYYALNDQIFTLSLTPNRADCLGVFGVAREIAALTDIRLSPLTVEPVSVESDDKLDIHIHAPDACALYCGRVIRNINSDATTPLWMRLRLERSGLRSINPVVDITNYVLLETGQPMHAFDLVKLDGAIHIRYAKELEKIQLLNDSQITLTGDMLLIADDRKPLALAGIMGGRDSGVDKETADIFLECAFFNPHVISGKSFRLGFSSDSAHRFERGVDFAATRNVLEYATSLIQSICGGEVGPVVEKCSELPQRTPVMVRIDRVRRVLGIAFDHDQIEKYFSRLQFSFTEQDNGFLVTPPSYRFDLAIEEDFVEELARIHGYDEIPAQIPKAELAMMSKPETIRTTREIKQMLVLRDYQEVINYAFVDNIWETELIQNKTPITLKNPIAKHLSVMRSSLIGGLIANLQFNVNRKQDRVRLFELGCCFEKKNNGTLLQIEKLAGLGYGDITPEQWSVPSRAIDYFDIKADVELLYQTQSVKFQPVQHPAFHPGKSAQILLGSEPVGWLGELHPFWQKKYDLSKPVILFELLQKSLLSVPLTQANEISKFLPVRRDIAVIVDTQIAVHTILDGLYEKKPTIVSEIVLFDLYRDDAVGENKKSLAFKVVLQNTDKTLTDEEIDTAIDCLLKILSVEFNAVLRS